MHYEFSENLKRFADADKKVCVLTGAGVSRESGIPTFRGKDGLWRNYDATQLATPEAFAYDPVLVWEWYNWRRGLIKPISPNPGHIAISRMENHYKDFTLITQNVDGLHAKAGNKKILELHGNIWQVRCVKEGTMSENFDYPLDPIPPKCSCGAMLRPNVVWFGEALNQEILSEAFQKASKCDLFLIVGTSGIVYPAASIPYEAKSSGVFIVDVNPEPSNLTHIADEFIQGPSGEALPQFLKFLNIP
ncbi:MAG: NAD-dependent deacylase [Acidobacteriota bacterium]